MTRLLYAPILAHLIVIRKCNLACSYCNEYNGKPIDQDTLKSRLDKLRELQAFAVCLTGGEPTLHPDLPALIRYCRHAGFARVGTISNGLRLHRRYINQLNCAGLDELQISIDGVSQTPGTKKVLNNLAKRLLELREHARFKVTVSAVIGACPIDEVGAIIDHVKRLGFRPRVLLMHDDTGRVMGRPDDIPRFEAVLRQIPRTARDLSNYRRRLIRDGRAPFKCRAGSRYLYVDEHGSVSWCSQTRGHWSKPLSDYEPTDLREQFHAHKPCQDACTLGCARSCSQCDNWRFQESPLRKAHPPLE